MKTGTTNGRGCWWTAALLAAAILLCMIVTYYTPGQGFMEWRR